MKLDLIASIALTASAAVVISALAIGLGESARARIRLAVAFVAWFVVVTLLGLTEAFDPERGLGTAGLGAAVILPIVVLGATVMSSAPLRRALRAMPLALLIGVNGVRILGVMFLILYGAGRLPAPFAPVAGWGDIVVAVTAVPVAWLAQTRSSLARPTILIWNAVGLADLIAAVGLGALSAPGPLRLIFADPDTAIMTSLPWLLVPGFLVPLLASTHLAVFYRLAKGHRPAAGRTGSLDVPRRIGFNS